MTICLYEHASLIFPSFLAVCLIGLEHLGTSAAGGSFLRRLDYPWWRVPVLHYLWSVSFLCMLDHKLWSVPAHPFLSVVSVTMMGGLSGGPWAIAWVGWFWLNMAVRSAALLVSTMDHWTADSVEVLTFQSFWVRAPHCDRKLFSDSSHLPDSVICSHISTHHLSSTTSGTECWVQTPVDLSNSACCCSASTS